MQIFLLTKNIIINVILLDINVIFMHYFINFIDSAVIYLDSIQKQSFVTPHPPQYYFAR